MTLRLVKRSNSVHHPSRSRTLNGLIVSPDESSPDVSPSSTEWAAQRFGFDNPSPNLLSQHYLATPETTPIHSRTPSLEQLRGLRSSSSDVSSPSNTFFEYELAHGSQARARSPLGPRMLSPGERDNPFSLSINRSPGATFYKDRNEDTRIEFERIGAPILSPVAGISSSIAVVGTVSTNSSSAISPARFSRTGQPTAHRRITSLDNINRTPDFTMRKTAPPPINVPDVNLWSEKPIDLLTGCSSCSSSPYQSRNFFSTLFRISESWSTTHNGEITPSPETDNTLAARSLIRSFILFPLGFIQFLLAPFSSLIHIPDFLLPLTNHKPSGHSPHSKPRGRKLPKLFAVAYVIFSFTMFSQEMCVRLGLMSRKSEGHLKALKVRLVSRKVEDLMWVRDWAAGHLRPSGGLGMSSAHLSWDPQLALKRRPVEIADTSLDANESTGQLNLNADPFSTFSHPARFAKLHSKLGGEFTSDIIPFYFKSTEPVESTSITACLYTNHFWLAQLVNFMAEWPGPVSAVVESLASDRQDVIDAIERLRLENYSIRARVDFHFVSPPVSDTRRDHLLHRMLTEPLATNAHLNLARFFSRSELIWLVGDARVTPGAGLYQSLFSDPVIRRRVLEYNDAIVVPTFGLARTETNRVLKDDSANKEAAERYMTREILSLSLPQSQWPRSKDELIRLASSEGLDETPISLFDKTWAPATGPTNWPLWKTLTGDSLLERPSEEGGGIGLGVEPDTLGGGDNLYRVSRYELNYAPNVLISREGQTWCTERFEVKKAACVYQMYLSGAEFWVTPVGWAFTLERMRGEAKEVSDAQRLMDSISARLYTKFHQEACMQYGREFLSLGSWEGDRARHLREMCSRVLKSWGVGAAIPVKP